MAQFGSFLASHESVDLPHLGDALLFQNEAILI